MSVQLYDASQCCCYDMMVIDDEREVNRFDGEDTTFVNACMCMCRLCVRGCRDRLIPSSPVCSIVVCSVSPVL